MKKVMSKGCAHRYTLTCLKLDVVSLVDRLSETDKYQLLPGVIVVRDNSSAENGSDDEESATSRKFPVDLVASLARDYPNDVDSRLDAFLIRKVGQYLNSHSITVKLFDEESFARARQLELEAAEQLDQNNSDDIQSGRAGGGGGGGGLGGGGGGGGGGKRQGMGQLLLAALLMKGTLVPIAFAALAGLAGKALMTGLLSLMLSAIIGLKSLTHHGGKQAVTYEIVQKPVYSHSHSHSHELHHEHLGGGHGGGGGGGGYGHSSYGRSFNLQPGLTFGDETSEGIHHRAIQGDAIRQKKSDSHEIAYSAYATQGGDVGHSSLTQSATLRQQS
ncbi:homeobox protein unc-4 [Cryptotermes secundus]|nr:homeobox protein unc-4 [Cryptotermes secundus]